MKPATLVPPAIGHSIVSWRTAELVAGNYDRVVSLIHDMYMWFAPKSTLADIRKRLCQHEDAVIDLLIRESDDTCIGFSVHYIEEFQGRQVMFRGGTIVRERSKGFYKALLTHSIKGSSADFLVAMTQNPRVLESLRSFSPAGIVHPTSGTAIPADVREIAEHFCRAPGLDLASLIVRGVYRDSIIKDPIFKTAHDPAVAEMFARTLGEDDAFFLVIPMK